MVSSRLVGKSGFMQHGIHELSRRIARERPPGAVGAVRPGRKSHDQHASTRIAEAGHRLAPIFLVAIGAALLASDPLPILHQARAAGAGDDLLVEYGKPAMLWAGFSGHDFKNITPPRSALHRVSAE